MGGYVITLPRLHTFRGLSGCPCWASGRGPQKAAPAPPDQPPPAAIPDVRQPCGAAHPGGPQPPIHLTPPPTGLSRVGAPPWGGALEVPGSCHISTATSKRRCMRSAYLFRCLFIRFKPPTTVGGIWNPIWQSGPQRDLQVGGQEKGG